MILSNAVGMPKNYVFDGKCGFLNEAMDMIPSGMETELGTSPTFTLHSPSAYNNPPSFGDVTLNNGVFSKDDGQLSNISPVSSLSPPLTSQTIKPDINSFCGPPNPESDDASLNLLGSPSTSSFCQNKPIDNNQTYHSNPSLATMPQQQPLYFQHNFTLASFSKPLRYSLN